MYDRCGTFDYELLKLAAKKVAREPTTEISMILILCRAVMLCVAASAVGFILELGTELPRDTFRTAVNQQASFNLNSKVTQLAAGIMAGSGARVTRTFACMRLIPTVCGFPFLVLQNV